MARLTVLFRMRLAGALITLMIVSATHAMAQSVTSPSLTLQQQELARELFKVLRCVVCVGQPLWESDVPLAVDMRRIITEKARAGESRQEIIDYFVARYGDDILMKPPIALRTLVLWCAPIAMIALLAGVVWYRRRP
ncbi:MAG: cytochrome c-type biogenesis protein [Pseudomonadota bacterium]